MEIHSVNNAGTPMEGSMAVGAIVCCGCCTLDGGWVLNIHSFSRAVAVCSLLPILLLLLPRLCT